MNYTITDSSASVGRYSNGRSWPWWALGLLLPAAFVWGLFRSTDSADACWWLALVGWAAVIFGLVYLIDP